MTSLSFRAGISLCAGAAVLFLGWAAASGHALLVVPVLTVPVLLALTNRDWAPYAVLLAAVSSVIWVYAYPRLFAASYGVYASEVLLALCLAVVLVTGRDAWTGRLTKYAGSSIAIGVFLCATAAGVAVASANGTHTSAALSAARPMVFYAAFWVAFAAVRTPASRRGLVAFVAVLACLIAALQIAQYFVGAGRLLFVLGSYASQVSPDPWSGGTLRIRPPGLTVVYVAAAFAAAYLLWGPRKRRATAVGVLALCSVGILLSLNRNMILGLVIGVLATGLVAGQRSRLVIAALTATLLLAVGVAVTTSIGWESHNALVRRTLSLSDVRDLQSGTLAVRAYENRLARHALARHWLTGIGWGTSYGATLPVLQGGTYVNIDRPWVHNQYYSIWLRTGIVGLLALIWALGLALWHACRRLRMMRKGEGAWMAAGAVTALVSLMASAGVGLYFTEPASIVPLTGVMALAVAIDVAPDDQRLSF